MPITPPSWEVFDQDLQAIYSENQDLGVVLNHLYQQQIDSGFLSRSVLSDIRQISPITHPDGFTFWLQFNPARANRGVPEKFHPNPPQTIPFKGGIPCFCCPEIIRYQWPLERGFSFELDQTKLIFLPNPAPIFTHHFTVISETHLPQAMNLKLMHALSGHLPDYWIIQNGPDVGATNPWHFHLQCFKAELPILTYPSQIKPNGAYSLSQLLYPADTYRLVTPPGATYSANLQTTVDKFLNFNPDYRVNLLSKMVESSLHTYIVIRHAQHRTQLYRTGQPGYAEMAGVVSPARLERFQEWMDQGVNLFTQLLSETRPHSQVSQDFLKLV